MNEKILKIFANNSLTSLKGNMPDREIVDLAIQIQGERQNSIVFYRITSSKDALEKFIERANQSNAAVLIINKNERLPDNFAGAIYFCADENWERAQVELCEHFYPKNSKALLVGITGTNGKTTSVNLTRDLLWAQGVKACSVGTIGLQGRDGVLIEDLSITTPSFLDIRRILCRYSDQFEVFVFEVSSHALDQNRFNGMSFCASAWTNLTQDHLDYHKDFESYGKAKAKIADLSKKLFILSNHQEVISVLDGVGATYESLEIDNIPRESPPFFHLAHNWENLILSRALAKEVTQKEIVIDWSTLHPPRGRFETIEWSDRLIVIDYAHTPDALSKILASTKESFPTRRIICIFGAGGDRDPMKRPIMGKLASECADLVVVTSDNPRSEDPQEIVDQILAGIERPEKIFFSDSNRKVAIEKTLTSSQGGDIIVIAGKGHETYQEVKGIKYPFDDKQVALDFINAQRD